MDSEEIRDVFINYYKRNSDFTPADGEEADFNRSLEAHRAICQRFVDYELVEINSFINGRECKLFDKKCKFRVLLSRDILFTICWFKLDSQSAGLSPN